MPKTFDEIVDLVHAVSKGKGAKFAGFTYTAKGTGETAKILCMLGCSTETVYNKDIAILEELLPTLEGIKKQAALEILNSRKTSLKLGIGNNPAYTCKDLYIQPEGLGVDVNVTNGTISILALFQSKTVLTPGEYKKVKSSDKTLAKKELMKGLRGNDFRRYLLKNFRDAHINGEVLELDCDPEVVAL